MNSVQQSPGSICSTCGEAEDGATGLCFACLMRCAAAPENGGELDIFADKVELPRIGSYELLSEIGRGGMGVIYEARHVDTGRLEAVKILQSHLTHKPELLTRFRREAEAASRFDHRNVLPIYEVNREADGLPYFSMKLAKGGSLVERSKSLRGKTREIAEIVAKVARAAHHAHERGVLHRDLKPGNILFDADGEPLVSDFGLAAWLDKDSDLTQTIMVFGTPGYLPPEYLDGRPEVLKPESDVYSIGVILFELIAGRQPIAAGSSLSTIRQAAEQPAPRLRSIVPNADRDLEVICARCLEIVPAMRYRSALALAEDLERWRDGLPIVARPVSPLVRFGMFVRRRPAAALAALSIVVLLVGGAILYKSRTQVATALQNATAYDRTVALLPVEDLDALSTGSDLATTATDACTKGLRGVSEYTFVAAETALDPLPSRGDLVRLSQRLGGRYLVSGTVRRREEKIRLVVHITDAVGDATLHKEVIECEELGSPETLKSIAGILANIKAKDAPLGEAGGGSEAEFAAARNLCNSYIQAGDEHFKRHTLPDTDLAIAAYEKAVKAQPKNASALASLANAMAFRSMVCDRKDWLEKAYKFAGKAIEVEPTLAEAQQTFAFVCILRGDGKAALEHSLCGYELEPSRAVSANSVAEKFAFLGEAGRALDWNRKMGRREVAAGASQYYRGEYLSGIGAFDEARASYQTFIEFRAELPDGPEGLANVDMLDGKTDSALKQIRDLYARFPTHPVVPQIYACMEFLIGDSDTAERAFNELADADAGLNSYLTVRRDSALGFLALRRHDPEGRKLVERALAMDEGRLSEGGLDPIIVFEKAANLAVLGRSEEALECLKVAVGCGQWTFFQMKLDPRLESLRQNPRFKEVAEASEEKVRMNRLRYQETASQ